MYSYLYLKFVHFVIAGLRHIPPMDKAGFKNMTIPLMDMMLIFTQQVHVHITTCNMESSTNITAMTLVTITTLMIMICYGNGNTRVTTIEVPLKGPQMTIAILYQATTPGFNIMPYEGFK